MAGGKDAKTRIVGNYELGDTLGKGTFGKVKAARHIVTGEQFAVKIVSAAKMSQEKLDIEIAHHQRLSHQHVVKIHEVFEQDNLTFIVMELVSGGDLFDHIVKHARLPEKEARRIFQQIIAGVEHCHSRRVAHRDLKPENIFMDDSKNVKIGDFGLSGHMEEGELLKDSCGSLNYAAPELLYKDCEYEGPEVDVWACGIILYALLCNRLPFDSQFQPELARLIKKGRFHVPGHISANANDLIRRILVVDPSQRMSMADIREHKWFQVDLPPELSVCSAKCEEAAAAVETQEDEVHALTDISNLVNSAIVKKPSDASSEFLDCLEAPWQPASPGSFKPGAISELAFFRPTRSRHPIVSTFAVSAAAYEQEGPCSRSWRRMPSSRQHLCHIGSRPRVSFCN